MEREGIDAMNEEELLEGLTGAEYDRLAGILAGFPDPRAMNLEQLDGFLAAVVCSPHEMVPEEVLPEIWGGGLSDEEAFADEKAMDEFLRLTIRHWYAVARRLEADEDFVPLLLKGEAGDVVANDWATGFVRGIALNPAERSSLVEDDEVSPALMPIFVLAHEHDPDPDLRPNGGPIGADDRHILIGSLAAAVPIIFGFFAEASELDEDPDEVDQLINRSLASTISYQREGPRVGRNEPCPCGSGKKYKRCCGADEG